jgi:hypothetical protein
MQYQTFPYRAMVWGNGTTLPKTAPDSYRLFDAAATWLRLCWMSRGAVLSIASDMALFGRGGCQEAFAKALEAKGTANGSASARPTARQAANEREDKTDEPQPRNTPG